MNRRGVFPVVVIGAVALGYLAFRLAAEGPSPRPLAPPDVAGSFQTHLTVSNPAALGGERAEQVYLAIRGQLQRAYAESDDPIATEYMSWTRYNAFPYRSASHGNTFVSNYANQTAAAYGKFEDAGSLPAGSIVAKDSFTVTEGGAIVTGGLFLMEKMAPGFDPANGDWRYLMVGPDGVVKGAGPASGADEVSFCAACHNRLADKHDRLFFIPDEARR